MKINKKMIKELNPCNDGWNYYLQNQEEDLLTFLLKVNSDEKAVDRNVDFQGSNWAKWLFTNLMTNKQCVEIAIFSAKQVLHIFEEQFSEDDRPRKAIEAAQNYLNNPNSETARSAWSAARSAARSAVESARSAVESARSAVESAAVSAESAAVSAAVSARSAAESARSARSAVESAAVSARSADIKKELQEKIIYEAVRILDRDN